MLLGRIELSPFASDLVGNISSILGIHNQEDLEDSYTAALMVIALPPAVSLVSLGNKIGNRFFVDKNKTSNTELQNTIPIVKTTLLILVTVLIWIGIAMPLAELQLPQPIIGLLDGFAVFCGLTDVNQMNQFYAFLFFGATFPIAMVITHYVRVWLFFMQNRRGL